MAVQACRKRYCVCRHGFACYVILIYVSKVSWPFFFEQRRLPTLFPDAQMRDRDAFAEALHGRLVKRSFYDPITKKKRVFWGRVHFRGVQARPNYFIILYEDGDWQTATTASLKKFLMPENTQLPAVSIPTLTAEEIYQLCYTGDSQPTAAAAAVISEPFVSVNVPLQDMQLLLNKLDLSRVAFLSYHGNVSQQLQAAMQQIGLPLKSALSADTASAAVLSDYQPARVSHGGISSSSATATSICRLVSARFPARC
jgi:hypothetical protein